jgi:two-component system sensor histidine kinase BaeS
MRSLRSRLILSHALPLLVIVPLVGIALIYILETQVLLTSLSRELAGQAILVAELAADYPVIWSDPSAAQAFVNRMDPLTTARVMLLDTSGHLLISSDAADARRQGQSLALPGLTNALAGVVNERVTYSQNLHTDVIDILVPVLGPDRRVVGIVRLSHQLINIYEQFLRLRYVVGGVLVAASLLGGAVGLVLALNLERSLRQVTEAIHGIASGQRLVPLPERGPEEIRLQLRAFNSLVERLHNLEMARHQLLANLVHELGRPLGALQSASQALLKGADQDAAFRRELLEGMSTTIQRLQPLLDNLAQLHGQVLGTLELNRQPTLLRDWLLHILAPWREAAQEKGLCWQVNLPQDLPALIIDADQLARVVGNLLSNAVKYTPSGGQVAVAAGVETGNVWIQVGDTGLGIAPEEQERIFDPFYRSHTNRRFPQGMGLGLSIARDLVVAHGGRITVKSQPGQGSRFTIWLPLD